MNSKRTFQDFLFSFLSIGISIGVLQLVVYPYLARTKTAGEYGAIIAVLGIITAVYQTFGGALSQTRLIKNHIYDEPRDFQLLLTSSSILVALLVGIFSVAFLNTGIKQLFMNIVLAVISTINTYAIVTFRIKIDYRRYFISNILIGVGYLVGIVLFLYIDSWQLIFIISQIFLFVYLYLYSNIFQEAFRVSKNFKLTLYAYLWLLISGALANSVQYLDKFLIYPILGGESASVFFTATFFAKSFSMIMLPINNVLLSYISIGKMILTKKKFLKISLITVCACFLSFLLIILMAVPVTRLFFPKLIDAAIPFFPISNAATLLGLAYGIIGLPLLVYAPTYWQFVLNIVQLTVYVSLALILTTRIGLTGFCYAMLVSNLLRIIISLVISLVYIKN